MVTTKGTVTNRSLHLSVRKNMNPRQTRIFVPPSSPFDKETWVENVVGNILVPVLRNNRPKWFWFSRYESDRTDSGDCNISKIPQAYEFQPDGIYRSLRFRFLSPSEEFEDSLKKAILACSCAISDIRDYSPKGDAASNRFLGEPRTEEKRKKRAELVISQFHATSELFIDCLKGPDSEGYFSLESDPDSGQNPHGSIFESVHHIFCNQTDVPLRVLTSQTAIGTDWHPPQSPVQSVRIRY